MANITACGDMLTITSDITKEEYLKSLDTAGSRR